MQVIRVFFLYVLVTCLGACDLQPKIVAIPESVGDFISARYPTLLADPTTQPEIYNSAATDYGVYASPELYGSVSEDDYVLYASVSDYIIPPQAKKADSVQKEIPQTITVTDRFATFKDKTPKDVGIDTVTENAGYEEIISVPEYADSDLTQGVKPHVITVAKGDTLYKLAKQYDTTVADLTRINNLKNASDLRTGQVLYLIDTKEKDAGDIKYDEQNRENKSREGGVVTQQVVIKNPVPTTTKIELQEITVVPGDTLYSISRRYSVPVNDLAVMNNISSPFALYTGQRLKVPNLDLPDVKVATSVTDVKDNDNTTSDKSNDIVVKTTIRSADNQKTITPAKKEKQTTKAEIQKVDKALKKNTNVKSNVSKQQEKNINKKAQSKQTKNNNTNSAIKKPSGVNAQNKKPTARQQSVPKITARSSAKFSWPVRGKILSHFGVKNQGLFNDGINIGVARGTAVKASENGVVAYAGNEVKGMGNLIIIQHSDGWMTVYAHMDSMIVRRGAKVSVGQKIGTVGSSGRVDKPQLHFEIRKGTKAYNPISQMKK